MLYKVEFGYGNAAETKTFESIESIKDYCCKKYSVQRFQVKIDNDGNVILNNKLGESFSYVGKMI